MSVTVINKSLSLTELVCGIPRPTTPNTATTTNENCYIETHGGTAGDSRCIFPFNYKGDTYTGCTTEDNDNRPWCYTSYNYNKDHLWSNCLGNYSVGDNRQGESGYIV